MKNTFFIFLVFVFSIVSCSEEENITVEPEPQNLFDFEDTFTVEVDRADYNLGETMIRENEIITQLNDSTFMTSTTGKILPEQLSAATSYGFTFYITSDNEIIIPTQNLAKVYLNQVQGVPYLNEPHGIIIDENTFQLVYEITNTSNVSPYPRYSAIYIRN